MQTHFSLAQLADPTIAEADSILRACVHCGFCTATCPTYVLLGDERDSPRGRIYLIKDMLEGDKPATETVARHVDRCLSCLSCMTTCPSSVHYAHLVDHARNHIEKTYQRPIADRLQRALIAFVIPHERRFRLALLGAVLVRPIAEYLPARLRTMLALASGQAAPATPANRPGTFLATTQRRARIGMLPGCVQPALRPEINDAAVRLLNRLGAEIVIPKSIGCCGALTQHMGREESAKSFARAAIDSWIAEIERGGLDAIIVTASGCGSAVKDYGHLFQNDPVYASKAARVSALARDVTEVIASLGLPDSITPQSHRIAYHAACSLQHGQHVREHPKALLRQAGFTVIDVPEAHLCCGSAGTYNMLQPELSSQLRDRKLANIATTKPEIIATGNIGCMTQLAAGAGVPIVHTVELLDWVTGGPKPAALH